MKRELGIARCGLACCVCCENADCVGCHADGCKDREWCENRKCTIKKGLDGCWQCTDFPCNSPMLAKPRVRAFAEYIRKFGAERLMDKLAQNERAGVLYHYPDQLVGDYDCFTGRDEIWDAIDNGLCYRGVLIKESLSAEDTLDLIEIEKTELWRTNDTPRYWTAVWFCSRDPRFPDKLSQSLTGNWYVDMKLGNQKLLVFAGKVMRYVVGDDAGRKQVEDYCRSIGIPEGQLDWSE